MKTGVWISLILLALTAAAGGRIWWTLPTTRDKQAKDESTRCMVWMQATHDALRMAGLRRGRSETPQQFFQRGAGCVTRFLFAQAHTVCIVGKLLLISVIPDVGGKLIERVMRIAIRQLAVALAG